MDNNEQQKSVTAAAELTILGDIDIIRRVLDELRNTVNDEIKKLLIEAADSGEERYIAETFMPVVLQGYIHAALKKDDRKLEQWEEAAGSENASETAIIAGTLATLVLNAREAIRHVQDEFSERRRQISAERIMKKTKSSAPHTMQDANAAGLSGEEVNVALMLGHVQPPTYNEPLEFYDHRRSRKVKGPNGDPTGIGSIGQIESAAIASLTCTPQRNTGVPAGLRLVPDEM